MTEERCPRIKKRGCNPASLLNELVRGFPWGDKTPFLTL
jgi:hypothetical protein